MALRGCVTLRVFASIKPGLLALNRTSQAINSYKGDATCHTRFRARGGGGSGGAEAAGGVHRTTSSSRTTCLSLRTDPAAVGTVQYRRGESECEDIDERLDWIRDKINPSVYAVL